MCDCAGVSVTFGAIQLAFNASSDSLAVLCSGCKRRLSRRRTLPLGRLSVGDGNAGLHSFGEGRPAGPWKKFHIRITFQQIEFDAQQSETTLIWVTSKSLLARLLEPSACQEVRQFLLADPKFPADLFPESGAAPNRHSFFSATTHVGDLQNVEPFIERIMGGDQRA